MHGGDEMCCQRRYNLSPATNCAGATKCAITAHLASLLAARIGVNLLGPNKDVSGLWSVTKMNFRPYRNLVLCSLVFHHILFTDYISDVQVIRA